MGGPPRGPPRPGPLGHAADRAGRRREAALRGPEGGEGAGPGPVPVTVLTGFLGSGKTTVLGHLLRSGAAGGKRLGVLVNDFGEVNIDADLIREQSVGELPMVELSNGCVCCTASGDVLDSLDGLLAAGPVDHIVLETSGVTSPEQLIDVLASPYVRRKVWLAGIVTVVDAGAFSPECYRSVAARHQLTLADVVVLNKVDLLGTEEEVDYLQTLVRELVGREVPVLEARQGRVPPAALLDLDGIEVPDGGGGRGRPGAERCADAGCGRCGGGGEAAGCSTAGRGGDPHMEVDGLQAVTFARAGLVSLAKFQTAMGTMLPASVLRIKGHVHFDVLPKQRYAIQMSGRQKFDLQEAGERDAAAASISLVIIGRGIRGLGLARTFEECLAAPGPGPAAGGPGVLPRAAAKSRASAFRAKVNADSRFQELAPDGEVVYFALEGIAYHEIPPAEMNYALLSAINADPRAPCFLTHTHLDGEPVLRFDARCDVGIDQLVQVVHAHAGNVLAQTFFANFCCDFR